MTIYSPTGLENLKTRGHDARNATRDDFEWTRGNRFHDDGDRANLVGRQVLKETEQELSQRDESIKTDAEEWEAHRLAEERGRRE